MKLAEISIITGGAGGILLVLFHVYVFRVMSGNEEIINLSVSLRNIITTIHLGLILLFVIFIMLSFAFYRELGACAGIAYGINLALTLLWLWRAAWQVYFFNPQPGQGLVHYASTAVYSMLMICYLIPIAARHLAPK